jgi:hypothetical protein
MQVIIVDHPPTKRRGRIISGVMLPCTRKNIGHLE